MVAQRILYNLKKSENQTQVKPLSETRYPSHLFSKKTNSEIKSFFWLLLYREESKEILDTHDEASRYRLSLCTFRLVIEKIKWKIDRIKEKDN